MTLRPLGTLAAMRTYDWTSKAHWSRGFVLMNIVAESITLVVIERGKLCRVPSSRVITDLTRVLLRAQS